MFQSIQVDEIFDPNTNQDHPAYWLAQLRKADWRNSEFRGSEAAAKTKKQMLAEAALRHFEFVICDGRGEVWKIWQESGRHRRLVIQFRHPESDWSRGTPEFVHLEKVIRLAL